MRMSSRLAPGLHNQGVFTEPPRDAVAQAEIFQPCLMTPLRSGSEMSPTGAGITGVFLVAVGRWRIM